ESETPVANVTGTSTVVTQLTNGTSYYFEVTAVNAAGEGPSSNEAPVTPAVQPTRGQPTQNQPTQNQPTQNQPTQNQPSQNQPTQNQPAPPVGSVPVPIILLAAAILVAGAVALAVHRLQVRSRTTTGPPQSVSVEPDPGAPGQTAVHSTGPRATVTV